MSRLYYNQDGNLTMETPYDHQLIEEFKLVVPGNARRYIGKYKHWLIDERQAPKVRALIYKYLGEDLEIPQRPGALNAATTCIAELRYLGQTKDRGGDQRSALGYDMTTRDWTIEIPESVLRDYFSVGGGDEIKSAITLYGVLGVPRDASQDEIKTSFRRLARQWHPDVCKEPDANERFIQIKEAHDLLSNDKLRARYNAGLALAGKVERDDPNPVYDNYKPPLRCGLIMANGMNSLGRFRVSKILRWEDITDNYGRVLVVSWPAGAKNWEERWA